MHAVRDTEGFFVIAGRQSQLTAIRRLSDSDTFCFSELQLQPRRVL